MWLPIIGCEAVTSVLQTPPASAPCGSSVVRAMGGGNTFKRRDGTAAISGHLYETKLLSLLYFKSIHDETIEDFQIASNVANIGDFDDVCFKATVKGQDKPVCLFIQAKHKENKKKTLKIDLATYLISYLKIRQHFNPNKKDLFFGHEFDETECYFVIYTTAKDGFSNNSEVNSSLCSSLHDLINTGGTSKQPYKNNEDEDVEFLSLCERAIIEQMALLAQQIAKYVMGEEQFRDMQSAGELMSIYHVVLEQRVFNVSEIHSEERTAKTQVTYRIATFRHGFLDTNDEYLSVFKHALYNEVLKKRRIKPTDINELLAKFLADTDNAEKLSKLIGTVLTYKYGVLQITKPYAEYINPQQLNEVNVSRFTVEQAIELAADEILLSPQLRLRVPAAFGNKDITVKDMKRIIHLTSKMIQLLDNCKYSKIVTIDDSLEPGLLRLNGGFASAIGNIFVIDENKKWMQVTRDVDALSTDAKSLYQSLNKEIKNKNKERSSNKIPDLHEYKFCFNFKCCPKLVLECGEHEAKLTRDFFKKLLIYSGQADEKGVEDKLRDEIGEHLQLNDYLQAKTEPTFLKFHNEIQIWWMLPKTAPYLNKDSQILNKTTSCNILDPLMSSISEPYMNKVKKYKYTFTEGAVRSLRLSDERSSTIILTEQCLLTVVKVLQHLKNKEERHIVLDLEYIVNLPINQRNALRRELTNTEKTLVFVCNSIPKKEKRTFINVAEAVGNKRTIIITKSSYEEIFQDYFGIDNVTRDDRNSLLDMSEESQINILASGKVKFQGIEVGLDDFVEGWQWPELKTPFVFRS